MNRESNSTFMHRESNSTFMHRESNSTFMQREIVIIRNNSYNIQDKDLTEESKDDFGDESQPNEDINLKKNNNKPNKI